MMDLQPKKTLRQKIIDNICKLSGEDYQLINNSLTDSKAKEYFFLIGFFVLIISISALYSCFVFVYNLFERNLWISIPIATVWAIIVGNIYILLLYTITPALVQGKERVNQIEASEKNSDDSFQQILSLALRIIFMALLAIVIAQPLVQHVYSEAMKNDIAQYKQNFRNEYIINADSSFIHKEVQIFKDLENEFILNGNSLDTSIRNIIITKITSDSLFLSYSNYNRLQFLKFKKDKKKAEILQAQLNTLVELEVKDDKHFVDSVVPKLNNNITTTFSRHYVKGVNDIIRQKLSMYEKLDNLLKVSNFYIRQIQLANSQYKGALIITLVVIFAFILPIIIKYRVRNKSNFYAIKQQVEKSMVIDFYAEFKEHYRSTFEKLFRTQKYNNYRLDKIREPVSFFEFYLDPPFNTIRPRKIQQVLDSKTDLLKRIYKSKEEEDSNRTYLGTTTSG